MGNFLLALMLLFATGGTLMRAFLIWNEPIELISAAILLYITFYFVIKKFFNAEIFNNFVQRLNRPGKLAILCAMFLIVTVAASRTPFRKFDDEFRYIGFAEETVEKNMDFFTGYNKRYDFHGQVAPMIILAHVYMEKAGLTGYPAHRALNNVLGVLSLMILYLLGQAMWNREIAFLSVVTIVGFNSFLVHSITAMLEMPLLFFFLLSIFSFFKLQETGRIKYCFYTAFFGALAFYSKYTGILFAPILLGVSLISKRPSIKHTFTIIMIFFLLIGAWGIYRIEEQKQNKAYSHAEYTVYENKTEQKEIIDKPTIQTLGYYWKVIKQRLYRTFYGMDYAMGGPKKSDWSSFIIQFPFLVGAHNLALLFFILKNGLYNLKDRKKALLFIPSLFALISFLILDPRPRYFVFVLPFIALLAVVNLKEKMAHDYGKVLLGSWSFSIVYYLYSFVAHKI